jgi:hypothetical protein
LLAAGSVAVAGRPDGYAWRCYVGVEASGLAPDMSLAEAQLRKAIARGERYIDRHRQSDRAVAMPPSLAAKYWQSWNDSGRKPAA